MPRRPRNRTSPPGEPNGSSSVGRGDYVIDMESAGFKRAARDGVRDGKAYAKVVAQANQFGIDWREASSDLDLALGWARKPVKDTRRRVWHFRAGIHCRVAYCLCATSNPPRIVFLDACQREDEKKMFNRLRGGQLVERCCSD